MEQFEKTEVLITVMTYPHPSAKYRELVCTAGVTAAGEWVRLYPMDYRYLPPDQRFHKYQWIEVELGSRGAGNDNRKESRKPKMETLRVLGNPISSQNQWAKRKVISDALPHYSRLELERLHSIDGTSLGIVRPSKVIDVKVEPVEGEWKPEWKRLFEQMRLFGPAQKPLRKLPYKFSYIFECEDSHSSHSAMIEDWELGALFLNETENLGSDQAAADSVREKYLGELCRSDKDTRFFMGTVFPWNSWVVLGVFWPPKSSHVLSPTFQGRLPI